MEKMRVDRDWSNSSLDEIGNFYGTDKSSRHHNYLDFYEKFVGESRLHDLKILEVGVFSGQSLATWEAFFPNATIIGCDINDASKQFERKRIVIEILDQSNIDELVQVGVRHGPFDLIIEDGSHFCEHQITTLRTLFPFLNNNGIYIVEDLQTNFGKMLETYRGISSQTCMEYLKKWSDLRVADDQIDISKIEDAFLRTYGRAAQYLIFYRRACLIKKNMVKINRIRKSVLDMSKPINGEIKEMVSILAHVSNVGDMRGQHGFMNALGKSEEVQGFSIEAAEMDIDYKCMDHDGNWSDWVSGGTFVGTRGKARFVRGLSVRLSDRTKATHDVVVLGRFQNGQIIEVENGEECVGDGRSPLCGFRVALTERRQSPDTPPVDGSEGPRTPF